MFKKMQQTFNFY